MTICVLVLEQEEKGYELWEKLQEKNAQITNFEIIEPYKNINENSLEEIWNGEKYDEFRKMHVTGNFPKGHKCKEKCDMKKLYQYLD